MVEQMDQILRVGDVLKVLNISRACFYKGLKKGLYPQPVRLGVRAVGWRASDIAKLIQNGIPDERDS